MISKTTGPRFPAVEAHQDTAALALLRKRRLPGDAAESSDELPDGLPPIQLAQAAALVSDAAVITAPARLAPEGAAPAAGMSPVAGQLTVASAIGNGTSWGLYALGGLGAAGVAASRARSADEPPAGDTTAPTAGIVVADVNLAAGETSRVTVTFSEAVSGLTADDLTVGNGSLSALASTDGGITWTATLTPAAAVSAGGNLITLASGAVTDAAGNASGGAVQSNTYTIDNVAPTASVTISDTQLILGETMQVTVTFSEAVSGLSLDDLAVSNGTLSGLASADGGITWTATYTPAGNVLVDGLTVSLAAASASDLAGNASGEGSSSAAFGLDTQAPGGTITVDETLLNEGMTAVVTFSFSEPVFGFDLVDLQVAGGTLSSPVVGSDGLTWTATLTPAAGTDDATNAVVLFGGGVLDAAGNAFGGTVESNNYVVRTVFVEHPADASTTGTIRLGSPAQGVVDTIGDADWYRVTLSAGVRYTIDVAGAVAGTMPALLDPTLILRSADGTPLANDNDSGPGLYSQLVYTPTVSGTYFIDAAGNGNAIGGYRVNLSARTDLELSTLAAGNGGFVIQGHCLDDRSGISVAAAGDVNGDGLADLIVGAYRGDPLGGPQAGRSYVVFGRTAGGSIALSQVAAGNGGFVIDGQAAEDRSGLAVAAAGDINGDGLADLLVGAGFADPAAGRQAGRAYVVFGRSSTAGVELSEVEAGVGGFVVNGHCTEDRSGRSLAGVGDVNGDGRADFIVGADLGDPATGRQAGRSYLVFGQSGQLAVELSAIAAGTGGFVINGQCADDYCGRAVAGAGDVNGDGLADLVFGADGGDVAGLNSGRSYVVFGRSAGDAVDLSAIAAGTGGFAILGQAANDRSGYSVAGAGDVNGDGLADVVVGAHYSDPAGRANAGRSYVVFGRSGGSAVSLSLVAGGVGGFAINGHCANDWSGRSVAAAGDVNGDGLGDLIVGAHGGDPATGNNAGRSYLVFGQTAGAPVNLSTVAAGLGGFVINGQSVGERSGYSVSAAGDVNGDGLADLLVGADGGSSGLSAGRAYVIFGGTSGAFHESAVDRLGTAGAETLTGSAASETLVAGAGHDTLVGNGGSDVLYGGSGDDVFVLSADNLARLAGGVAGGNLARVDGGAGIDTVRLAEGAGDIDLRQIANPGGMAPAGSSRLVSIERFDLAADSAANTLTLTVADVHDLTGANLINTATAAALGWTSGTYVFPVSESRHQLVVTGAGNDSIVQRGSVWVEVGTVVHDGNANFTVYNSNDGLAQVLVAPEVSALTFDSIPPTLTVSGNLPGIIGRADRELVFTIVSSEPLSAFDVGHIVVTNGVKGVLSQVDATTYSLSVTANDGLEGILAVEIESGAGADAAGNQNVVARSELAVDTRAPASPVIDTLAGDDVVNATETWTEIAGSAEANSTVELTFGNTSLRLAVDGAGQWQHIVTLDDIRILGLGQHTITAVAEDGVGNRSAAAAKVIEIIAPASPSIEVIASDDIVNALETGSTISGTAESGISLAVQFGGDVRHITADGSGQWTYTLVEADIVAMGQGEEAVSVQALDAVGNASPATVRSIFIDTVYPAMPVMATVAGDDFIGAGETASVIAGTADPDAVVRLSLGGAVRDIVTGADGNWAYVLTPADIAAMGEGDESITAAVTDAAGNSVSTVHAILIDTVVPSAVVSVSDASLAVGESALVTIVFNELVTGLSNSDLAFANGALSPLVSSDGGRTWTAILTPTSGVEATGNVITLAADSVVDAVGNTLAASVVSAVFAIDTLPPGMPTIAVVAENDVVNASEAATAVSGTADAGATFALTLGGVVHQVTADGAGHWAYTLLAADITAMGQGAETISTVASDAFGNTSMASRSIVVDTVPPEVAITLGDVTLGVGETTIVTITFTETVTGFANADLTVANGTLSTVASADGGRTWTAVLTPIVSVVDATNTIRLAAGSVTDVAGNTNDQAVDSVNYAVDSVPPPALLLSAVANGSGGFVINGQYASDASGFSVAAAGDVNGDGLADLLVGARNSSPAAGDQAGRSYIVFGRTATGAINLSALAGGSGGFVINGQCAGDRSGYSVSAAGDLNGDGLDDVIVGAWHSAPGGQASAGRSYVVFGKTATAEVDLSAVASGNGGFVINGHCLSDHSGISVAAAGDVNGDGLADVIVGAYLADAANPDAGRSYVVFGKTATSAVNLSAIADVSGGFVINGEAILDRTGQSVSSAGDVNGDGLADLIVGSRFIDANGKTDAGRSYVVFGKTAVDAVNLAAVAAGSGGFVISGYCQGDKAGFRVAGAGDVNGDGLADLVVGAPYGDPGISDAGRAYVVFGKTAGGEVLLSAIAAGSGGFAINGAAAGDRLGTSVAAAGDVNGDGLGDLIVGAPDGDPSARISAGRSYVVFGTTGAAAVEVSAVALGNGGFVIEGHCTSDRGATVSPAGDINGDGLGDLIVGAPYSDPAAGGNAGRSYVILGSTAGAFKRTAVDQMGTGGADALVGSSASETLVAGAGNDTLTGNGGADVFYGGGGDDVIVLNADNLGRLTAGVSDGNYSRLDGGAGSDTLRLDGAGMAFDLAAIANQGGGGPGSTSRLESIEIIDLTGNGNNTLSLSYRDVVDLSGMNVFNNAGGWADGSYNLAAGGAGGINPEQRHQLVVDGNAGDTVVSGGGWVDAGNVTFGGNTYEVYNFGSYVQLLVDFDLTRAIS